MTPPNATGTPRIPGPAALPVVGNLFEVLGASQETSIEFAEDYHAKYGGMFALDVLHRGKGKVAGFGL